MFLTVGEISKALGISSEAIRYYVKEGIITPKQNKENNYWEYSSDDLMKLTDVLFYRSMNFTMKEIKLIMDGLPLEKIGEVMDVRKRELIKQIKESVDALDDLIDWKEKYKEELNLIGKFKIGEMPAEFRRYGCLEDSTHMAKYLQECFNLDKGDWKAVSISFFFDLDDNDGKLQRYLSIEGSLKIQASNANEQAIEEKAENCIITEVHYSDDVYDMIQPIIDYAEKEGFELEGKFYGREDTNYFVEGRRTGLYKVYAPIKKQKK